MKNKNKGKKKVIITASCLFVLAVAICLLFIPLFKGLKFGLDSQSKDWAGNKHFNGGGSGSAQVVSSSITMVSDKFIYLSQNGGTFTKYKVYISVNGGSFTEVKKEKLKIIS